MAKKKVSEKSSTKKAESSTVVEEVQQQVYPTVTVKCRRGRDQMTDGQTCKSLIAENLSMSPDISIFRCSKCKFQWQVATGGYFQY